MKKKLLSFIILLCTLLSSFPIAVSAAQTAVSDEGRLPFEDVNTSAWYGDAAVYCYANGVINGTSKYTFDPAGKLTRAQFVTVLYNIGDKGADAYYKMPFTDVSNGAWYYNALAWCYDNGIVSGTSPTSFSPNAYITRQEIARMMMLYMKYKGHTVSVNTSCLDKYTDKSQVADWGEDGMQYLVSAGLISGITDTILSPRSNVTRAQTARIVMVYMQEHLYGECEHSFTPASCTKASSCSKCGMTNGLPNGHIVSGNYNCKYTGKCLTCSKMVLPSKVIHDFAPPTCGKPYVCKSCGEKRGEPTGQHDWWEATCINPKMCKVCYKTEGQKLGHNYSSATCTLAKRCKRCNQRNGEPLGHDVKLFGDCKRCGTRIKADSFDKVIEYISYHCGNYSWYTYPIYGCVGQTDSAGALCTQSMYYDDDEGILKLKVEYYMKSTDTTLDLEIFIPEKSNSYQYTIKAYGSINSGINASASGYINPANVYKGMSFNASNYSGSSSFKSTFNTYSYRALMVCMEAANNKLKECYSDVSYLGFVNYK